MLAVAVLGPVELRRDAVRLKIPAGKTTEVLVRLALDAGLLVRTERLIEDLWSEQPRGVARNTLQAKVSKLRRVLGDPGLVIGESAGYTLAIDPGCVDALEALRLAQAATSLREAGDARAAAHACATALALFRGEILPGAGDGEWVEPHRARLEEARLRLTEDHLTARLDLGAAGELVGELEGLVAVHPLRERLWTLLITALYRSGRQADALAAYRRIQQHLADELGLDPGVELQTLEQGVLRQDERLYAPARQVPAREIPGTLAKPARGNLPALSASLVGRDGDLAAITALVGDQRLVTVVGPAGVGKTRLAIDVARGHRVTGGSWLVRLENARTPASLPRALGEAFTVSGATEAMVIDRLRAAEVLLVLDNCEHLVEAVAEMTARLVDSAPGLRVLATSQVPLGLDGESVYVLEPLPIADSVALFAQRAAQRRKSFVLDPDVAAAIEDVCRSLDGLPLAIELAAARTKALSVQEIARRLDDRFTLLSDPSSRRPERHRALGTAIAWSYDLLFPDEQRGLWALACFSGGAPVAAAEHVVTALGVPAASTLDVIGRLADRSLVSVDIGAGGVVRYRLLDSVREFSIDRLRQAGIADVAFGAHASWFAAAATRAAHGVRGREQVEHVAVARAERANIDGALTWARSHDPALGVCIATGFGWAWFVLGSGVDGAHSIRAALAAADTQAAAPDRATGLLLAGLLEASGGNVDRAIAEIEQGMAGADSEDRGVGLLYLAFVRSQQGRAQDALALLAECRADFQRLGRDWEEGASWLLSAWAEIALGETDRGAAACHEAVRLLRPLGDQWALNHAEAILGALAQAEHRFADATAHLERAADATHELGFAAAEAHHLTNLGRAQQQSGDQRSAVATLQRAIETAHRVGDLRTVAIASVRLGAALRWAGERESARAIVQQSQRWYLSAGGGDGAALAECLLAGMDAEDGAPDAAGRLADVLERARAADDLEVQVLALDALAALRAEGGDVSGAFDLLERADGLMSSAAHLMVDSDRLGARRARSLIGALR